MMPRNPFIFAVGLMNLGAAVTYARQGAFIMTAALVLMAGGAAIQSYATVN